MQFGKEGTVHFYGLSAARTALIYKYISLCFERLETMEDGFSHGLKIKLKGDSLSHNPDFFLTILSL